MWEIVYRIFFVISNFIIVNFFIYIFTKICTYAITKSQFLVLRKRPREISKTLQTISSYPPSLPSFSTLCFVFVVAARIFAVEQFRIRRWKANGKTNLMIYKQLKIGRLEPEKSRNKFQRTQKMKKSRAIVFDFVFCFRRSGASFCRRTISNTALKS